MKKAVPYKLLVLKNNPNFSMEINQAIHSSGNLHILNPQGTQIYISQKRKSHHRLFLEAEIDRLVYELYGLIEEEIGIVENN